MKIIFKVITTILFIWLFALLYLSHNLYRDQTSSYDYKESEGRLSRALKAVDDLRKQNGDLLNLANEIKSLRTGLHGLATSKDLINSDSPNTLSAGVGNSTQIPSLEHELSRRRIEYRLSQVIHYLRHKLSQSQNTDLANVLSHVLTVQNDLLKFRELDGGAAWKQKEAAELGAIVQRRIHYLQNPADCNKAKKLVCNLNKGCGFGCQIHHIAYCLVVGYVTKRTLVIETAGWRYAPGGFETAFLPLSNNCRTAFEPRRSWGRDYDSTDVQVLQLPIIDSVFPKPKFLPLAIPADLAPRLLRLHSNPFVWWIGQFMHYILRPQPWLQNHIDQTMSSIRFKTPIVGVHVRRTDKIGSEAQYHDIAEYMRYVDLWFAQRDNLGNPVKRRVFLATDDAKLLQEARTRYPEIEILGDHESSASAQLGVRYTPSSLRFVLIDIYLLSLCDYLVCTFSSQVCRVAYELMQTRHPDWDDRFQSLDDIYYFGGQHGHDVVAVESHVAQSNDEISFNSGDKIGIAGNHWNGYSKGTNRRTGRNGLFPSYKVEDVIVQYPMPTYPEADNFMDASKR